MLCKHHLLIDTKKCALNSYLHSNAVGYILQREVFRLKHDRAAVVVIVIATEGPTLCFSFGGKGSKCKR
jgi:hypothetical protein